MGLKMPKNKVISASKDQPSKSCYLVPAQPLQAISPELREKLFSERCKTLGLTPAEYMDLERQNLADLVSGLKQLPILL